MQISIKSRFSSLVPVDRWMAVGARKHVIKLIIIFLLMKHFPLTPFSFVNNGTSFVVLHCFLFHSIFSHFFSLSSSALVVVAPFQTNYYSCSSRQRIISRGKKWNSFVFFFKTVARITSNLANYSNCIATTRVNALKSTLVSSQAQWMLLIIWSNFNIFFSIKHYRDNITAIHSSIQA